MFVSLLKTMMELQRSFEQFIHSAYLIQADEIDSRYVQYCNVLNDVYLAYIHIVNIYNKLYPIYSDARSCRAPKDETCN